MVEEVVQQVHSLLLDHLPIRNSKTPSGWVIFDCVMCSDKRKRAGVNQQGARITYNCFNCGHKTGWSPAPYLGKKFKEVAERLGADKNEIHGVQMELLKHSDDFENADLDSVVYNVEKYPTVEIPPDTISIDDLPANHELVVYAKERGIYGLYPLLHFPEMLWNKRLIIPYLYNNELVGWSGRHIAPPNKNTSKYIGHLPPGSSYVFNIDRFLNHEREIVIVVEGIMDAILIDGVAVMRNQMTSEQAHQIEKLGKRIIVCPDRDDPGKALINQSIALGWDVSFPPWADGIKDAADACAKYGRLATVASIIKHATNNEIKKKVMMRMT